MSPQKATDLTDLEVNPEVTGLPQGACPSRIPHMCDERGGEIVAREF